MHFFSGQIPLENPPGKFPSTPFSLNKFSRKINHLDYFPANIPRQIFGIITPRKAPLHFLSGQIPLGNSLQKIAKHSPTCP